MDRKELKILNDKIINYIIQLIKKNDKYANDWATYQIFIDFTKEPINATVDIKVHSKIQEVKFKAFVCDPHD